MVKVFLSALLVATSATAAHARVNATAIALNPPLPPFPIGLDGWQGYAITLTTVSPNHRITGVDLKTDVMQLGVPIGIRGPLHQRWATFSDLPSPLPTPFSTQTDPQILGPFARRDSFFMNWGYYTLSLPHPFTEDNNGMNGPNPPFTQSPLVDFAPNEDLGSFGSDFGVGSEMTFAGHAPFAMSESLLHLAFIVVPAGGIWEGGYNPDALVTVQGAAYDSSSSVLSAIQLSYLIPEPATLGLMIPAGLAMLARRRGSRHYVVSRKSQIEPRARQSGA